MVSRGLLCVAAALSCVATTALSQRGLSALDSGLVRRILLAEDRRDTTSTAFAEGARHADRRIQVLARRAAARVRDPRFVARDSFPALPVPQVYAEPAWRLRLRALTPRTECAALHTAMADSAWPVRLRAMDLVRPECARDTAMTRVLRDWANAVPGNSSRTGDGVSWHAAAHALVALTKVAPTDARLALPAANTSSIPQLRAYAARAAGALADTTVLRRLARDDNDNVKEAAISSLMTVAKHDADDEYIAALNAPGFQAVRAAARALAGSPRQGEVLAAVFATSRRIRGALNDPSRDARMALLERVGEFATQQHLSEIGTLTADFDCDVARAAIAIAVKLGAQGGPVRCTAMNAIVPPEAVALALGRDIRLRVTLADSSGGGSFVVKLRGDVAPIMAARVLALAREGYYNNLTWHRVEHDFVIQGGGPGANEYVGYPRFFRDELGTVSHARGTVGMSTRGHDTGDAQWFVNLRDNARLTRDYTVFAEVIEGIDVVDGVLEGDVIARIEVVTVR
ncbi:MAG TPA: peptidylprolyl isomerase [Gemmatimonadaceae bacterium]|nr:peptidylprolyl isomerase [Gemmatimonadaceae bacterium]